MGSTRRPGKVIEHLAGTPALVCIVERLERVSALDGIVVLVPESSENDVIRALCRERGIKCFSGSEEDVLDRFHAAAALYACTRIVRITADCPLVDPEVVGEVIELGQSGGADFASVVTGALPASPGLHRFPDGLDAEVVKSSVLEVAWREAEDPFEREHVTPFVWRRPERFTAVSLQAPSDLGDERWTVDHDDDLVFVRAVYDRLASAGPFGYRDVLGLLEREPELRALNAAGRAY